MTAPRLRAIIFDFNGVIADDEILHFLAFQQALADNGLALSKEEYYGTYWGMDERNCAMALLTRHEGKVDAGRLRRILERKAILFDDHTNTRKPPLFPGVVEFITEAAGRYRLAIASGGRREQIDRTLRGTPIERSFVAIVSAEDSTIGKPDPQIYQLALQRINRAAPTPLLPVKAQECVVIEDSMAGIRSAHAAGMKVVALATTYQADQLVEADCVMENFSAVSFERLEILVGQATG